MASVNTCTCPSPPGGRVQCKADQAAYCWVDEDGSTNSGCIDIPESLLPRDSTLEEKLSGRTHASRALAMKIAGLALPTGAGGAVATETEESLGVRGAVFRGRAGKIRFSIRLPAAEAVMSARPSAKRRGLFARFRIPTGFGLFGAGLAVTAFAATTVLVLERIAASKAAEASAEVVRALEEENEKLRQAKDSFSRELESYRRQYPPPSKNEEGPSQPHRRGSGDVPSTPRQPPGAGQRREPVTDGRTAGRVSGGPETSANCQALVWPNGQQFSNVTINEVEGELGAASWTGPAIAPEITISTGLRREPSIVQWYVVAKLCAHRLHPLSPIWTDPKDVEATYCEAAAALIASKLVPSADELARIEAWAGRGGASDRAARIRTCFGR
jgi:hypothetical protein